MCIWRQSKASYTLDQSMQYVHIQLINLKKDNCEFVLEKTSELCTRREKMNAKNLQAFSSYICTLTLFTE
jgi:hypothetical protein